MCYDDETCTTTCPSSRRRREAQRALGIYRRETVDGVDFQDNGLPGKPLFSVILSQYQLEYQILRSSKINARIH